MKRVGLIRDPLFMEHITSDYHPEHPRRLEAIYHTLDRGEAHDQYITITPREATAEDIHRVHTEAYHRLVESTCGCGRGQLDPDTHISSETYRVAKRAAGGLMALVDAVFSGEIHNGIALVRPPGHHAEHDRGMGFCIYNNVAIAARYAQDAKRAGNVLIIDWDLHHGNGTQHTFARDDTVLYFSTHQFPFYPGTGRAEEVGLDKGAGYTINVPLPGGQEDQDYLEIFQSILDPVARRFQPDLILVSAGFDIYQNDPLGSMRVTENGFARMTRFLMTLADRHCQGRLLMTLEGGYDVDGQARSVEAVLRTLSGEATPEGKLPAPSPVTEKVLGQVRTIQQPYWDL